MNLRPELEDALRLVKRLYKLKDKDLYITSANDSDHSMDSYHYSNRAIDFRKTDGINMTDIQAAVGDNFDVIQYAWGWHLEYDPKN